MTLENGYILFFLVSVFSHDGPRFTLKHKNYATQLF